MFKKTLLMLTLVILTLPLVYATVADVRPYNTIIRADDYPDESSTGVEITVKNPAQYNDNKPVNVSFTKGNSIKNYVTIGDNYFILQPDEERVVIFTIDLTGPSYVSGSFETTFSGVGEQIFPGHAENFIVIYGEGTGGSRCLGTDYSCGTWPNCEDVSQYDGCYDGYYRDYSCAGNEKRYSSRCTTPCCEEFFGEDGYCSGGQCMTSGNNPPVIDDYTPQDLTPTITEGDTLKFNHTSSDANGDTLTYSWLLNETEESTQVNYTFVTVEDGVYNVTLIVNDGIDIASQEWEVTVQEQTLLVNGENCTDDVECQSDHCVHDVCRESDTYCGDGHCDSGESCSSCSADCGSCSSGDDDSGSSGSSGSGTWGGSGSSTQTTGFYDFPAFVQVESGKEASTEGFFYSKYRSDQTNVEFKISGLNNNWFTISPSSVSKVGYEEEVDITIIFNVPQDTASGDYPFEISTKIGTITYDETITLTVTANQAITTTTLENITNLEGPGDEEESQITGFFTKTGDVAKKFWYVPVIPAVLFLAWKFLGSLFVEQETDYFPKEKTVKKEKKQKKEPDYLEIKQEKPKVKVKEIEQELEIEKKPEKSKR